jgi:hypothetical protein
MEAILNWILRAVIVAIGLGAGIWILSWLRGAWGSAEERWPLRVAIGMLVLAAVYAGGHVRLLAQREQIEEGRRRYVRYGDPRRTEQRRAEVRGWILGCREGPEGALALYRAREGVVERFYPLGAGGANLVGGGPDADERDYTVERLFAEHLREPLNLMERGELHPAGTDLGLTLCAEPTAAAWELLRRSGFPGAVVVQDVQTGALVAYASTGGPDQPPMGIQEYAAPGSVFKLALAAIWWENRLPDTTLGCESTITVTARSTIRNSEGFSIPRVAAPHEMLVYSCNTTAVRMAMMMRERLGEEAFVEAYRRFGFLPYTEEAPSGFQRDFWATTSDDWARRVSPPPARIRIGERTGPAEWAQLAIGQGPLDATPIHVSRFLQAIGNGGVMMRPTLEQAVLEEPREGERVMSQETARRLMLAMREVVDRGTGRRALPVLEGLTWDLGGKTGTAQVSGAPDNGWFGGLVFGPDNRPRYTVVVFLKGGGPGGRAPTVIAAGMTRVLASAAAEAARTAEEVDR